MHFLSDCHLCVDLVGLLRQLPAFSVQICKSQRPLRAKFRRGSCSSRLQVYTRDNLTNWFRSRPEVSQDRRTSCAEELKDAQKIDELEDESAKRVNSNAAEDFADFVGAIQDP